MPLYKNAINHMLQHQASPFSHCFFCLFFYCLHGMSALVPSLLSVNPWIQLEGYLEATVRTAASMSA